MDTRWCPQNMFTWSARESGEIHWKYMKYKVYPLPLKNWDYPGAPRELTPPELYVYLCTAQSTQSNQSQSPGHSCQQKNKTMVKLSISRVNLVLNANAKFNLAFKQ